MVALDTTGALALSGVSRGTRPTAWNGFESCDVVIGVAGAELDLESSILKRYIIKITRVQQGTAFSTVWYKNDVTDQITSFFYRGKQSVPFCCCGRIEIKYLFSRLLQNNLISVKMLFEIHKLFLFYFKLHFSTSEVILQQTRKCLLYFF